MGVFPLIITTLLVNPVTSVTDLTPTDEINVFSELPATVFTFQIKHLRTSEAKTAVLDGNNLLRNDGKPLAQDVKKKLKPISTIYPLNDKINSGSEDGNGGKNKLFSSTDGNVTGNKENDFKNYFTRDGKAATALHLTWNDCFETIFRENSINNNVYSGIENPSNSYHTPKYDESGEFWHKRNVVSNNSANRSVLVYQSKIIKNIRHEKRQQQNSDPISIKKVTKPAVYNLESLISTVQIIPITREVFKDTTSKIITENDIVTESNSIASYTEDWFETNDLTKIRFNGLPQRESYLIPALKIGEGFHPFSFMSDFFYLIYPTNFPVVICFFLGLIKDIIWRELSFPYSFLQAMKVESMFLAFIIVFACIALVIPSYLLILLLLSLFTRSNREDDAETGILFHDVEESNCRDKALVFVTIFVVLLCCVLLGGMEVNNEQAHDAAGLSKNLVSCACSDIATWLSSAARELHHSLVPPVDLVMFAYKEDLKNAEKLLGEPIQQAISSESGIDLVFESLADIIAESEDISNKISSLRNVSIRAEGLATEASDKIKELSRQFVNLKKQCTIKDVPLCETVNTNSWEIKIKFDMIIDEQQLLELRILGVDNLTRAVSTARQEFRALPSVISMQTARIREDILKDIEIRRQEIHNSAKVLNDIARHLSAGLHYVARRLEPVLDRIQIYELWRWAPMLACVIALCLVMMLILTALICGCGKATKHPKITLKVSVVFLCLASIILWIFLSTVFLISSHAEIYICHALKDSPQYGTLTALFDRPSPILPSNEGIFDTLFRGLENITIDVPIKDVLRDCENDRPAYIVFQLDKILDINKETSYFEWDELQADLGRLAPVIDVGLLKSISLYFSQLLNKILAISDVNLAKYRDDYNVPVVGKDLPSLIDQLENVAAQVTDLTTTGRLEILASRIQRLYNMNIKPLEQLRAEMVYKLTELELKLTPFRKKLNISLSHIHTAQYYIDNQGDFIARKKASTFTSRLISHAAGWRTHVLTSVGKYAARCHPLFTVFEASRSLLCDNYVEALHGWWVCGFCMGVIWCSVLTPLCVKLWRFYGRKVKIHEAMLLATLPGQQETPTTALCDGSNWNTPGPPPPPRSDSW